MSPLLSRRRSRRRSISGRLTVLIAAAVVLALVIGGLFEVSHESGTYDNGFNRSLAAQGSVVATQSAATGTSVRHLMANMPSLDRQTLQADLDGAVQQADAQSVLAQRAADPAAPGSLAGRFAAVFVDRATAVNDLRSAVDGLLGMHPLAVVGANSVSVAQTPTLLTSTQATDRIAAAGSLLAAADANYRAVRHDLRSAIGHHRLPPSVWVTNAQTWQSGAVADQVDLVAGSNSLAATHDLVLRAVQLSPPALPTAVAPSSGTSVLTPTSQIQVTAIVADLGSVDEPHAQVQFVLTEQGAAGTQTTKPEHASVISGGSVTLPTVTFGVKPGHSYQLTVSIVLPASQSSSTGTSQTETLQIAPGT